MACPYFYPVDRIPESAWPKHPRLPLGDPYTGLCRAGTPEQSTPDQDTLRAFCNLGYGRGKCPHFPHGSGPDAYRFSVVADRDGELSIFYVAERGHGPLASGLFECSASGEAPLTSGDETFRQQAHAYVESYLRRQREPETNATHPNRR
jgi:hypothetical protein